MTIPIDLITQKKLILVKQLYQQAVILSASQHSVVGRMMALIGFDLATETILKAIVAVLEPAKLGDKDFQGLVQQADNALTKAGLNPVPDKVNIQYVHSLRNDAQHKAKYPNETDVSDCRTYVKDFFQKITNNVWGLSFETISLTNAIQHDVVKGHLVAAETALASGDYQEALIKADVGFSVALNLIRTAIVGRMNANANPSLTWVGYDRSKRSTYELLEIVRDFIVRFSVGLNFPEYVRYTQIVGSIGGINLYQDGSYSVNLVGGKLEQKDAEFVVAYAINSVIQIESAVGNLDMPFGSSDWR